MKHINKNTTLEEILKIDGAEEILMKHNLPCLSCPFAALEIRNLKLGQVCKFYGLDEKKIIEEINSFLDKVKEKK